MLRTPDQQKRRELSLIVRDVLKNGDKRKYILEWDKDMLYGKLSVGYLVEKGNGHVMSLHTLNSKKNSVDTVSFNAVDIAVDRENSRIGIIAYQMAAAFQENGYASQVREVK